MSNMTALERKLDARFQLLAKKKPCACCTKNHNSGLSEYEEYEDATGKPWPKFNYDESFGPRLASANHHIIHRATKITRWDWRNGLPVCQECHNRIHSEGGFNEWVEMVVIGQQKMDFLKERANVDLKRGLIMAGQTEAEWQTIIGFELDEQLDNGIRYICESESLPF